MDTMGRLPAGRAMWEGGQAIDAYGTSLALMLLPYWTHGRIASMEGLYYESAATTPFHFMAVAPLSGPEQRVEPGARARLPDDRRLRPRRPVPAAPRASATTWRTRPRRSPTPTRTRTCKLVAQVPDRDKAPPLGWNIYEVQGRGHGRAVDVRAGGRHPARRDAVRVLRPAAGRRGRRIPSSDRGSAWPPVGGTTRPPSTGRSRRVGPRAGPGCRPTRPASAPRRRLPAVKVTDIHKTDDTVSFHVSRTGVPVVVRTSYFPNWEADGAEGPVAAHPELHGRGADVAHRDAALRPLRPREARDRALGRGRRRAGRPDRLAPEGSPSGGAGEQDPDETPGAGPTPGTAVLPADTGRRGRPTANSPEGERVTALP